MIPIRDLFESHLTVTDLQRSMSFLAKLSDWNSRKCFGIVVLLSTG